MDTVLEQRSVSRTLLKPVPEEAPTITSYLQEPISIDTLLEQPAAKRQRIDHGCHICGTTYTERRTLLRHQRTPAHCEKAGLPVLDFPCSHCRRRFTRSDLLKRHVRETHEGLRRSTTLTKPFALLSESTAAWDISNRKQIDGAQHVRDELCHSSQVSSSSDGSPSTSSTPIHHGAATTPCVSPLSSFAGSTIVEAHRSTPDPTPVEDQPIDLADAVSVMSISTTASLRSSASVHLPFRSRVMQFVKGGANPRSQALLYVAPCPLCNKELGKTSEQVKSHIDRHYQELCGEVQRSCDICQVSFAHAKDLEWHLACANKKGSCGFTFFHTRPCSGHHPPVSFTTAHSEAHLQGSYDHTRMPRTDHATFTRQLRNWETAQLSAYRKYLEDHASGRIATNAPTYAAPASPLFRRSTGSIESSFTYSSSGSSPAERGGRLRRAKARPEVEDGVDREDVAKQRMHSRNSALDLAIRFSDLATARRLVARKADMTANGGLKNKVMAAFRNVNADMLRFLFDIENHPKNSMAAALNNPTAWHLLDFLSLWEHGPRDDDKQRADCVSIVRQHLVSQDLDAIYRALAAGSEPLLRSLDLDQVYQEGQTALLHFLQNNNVEAVVALLEAGANVNVVDHNGRTALMLACQWGYSDLAQRCLSAGANLNAFDKEGTTALMLACQCSSVDSVRVLLEAGADVRKTDWAGNSALMFACCEHGRADFVQQLLEAGAGDVDSIDAKDVGGRSSLMLACQHGHVDSVRFLLDAGADPNAKDLQGRTSLMIACRQQFTDMMNDLLQAETDLALENTYGATSLMYSCAVMGQTPVIRRLVDAGSNIDATDRKGSTALMRACRRQSRDVVRALLDADARLDIVDESGKTALMHAVDTGNPMIADLLVQVSAST